MTSSNWNYFCASATTVSFVWDHFLYKRSFKGSKQVIIWRNQVYEENVIKYSNYIVASTCQDSHESGGVVQQGYNFIQMLTNSFPQVIWAFTLYMLTVSLCRMKSINSTPFVSITINFFFADWWNLEECGVRKENGCFQDMSSHFVFGVIWCI